MSLTSFCEYEPLRHAFKALHNAECRKIGSAKTLVPRVAGNHPAFVGMGFDYLARFSIAARSTCDVWQRPWVAESVVKRVGLDSGAKAGRLWEKRVKLARLEMDSIEWKPENFKLAAETAQYLANLDYLLRHPDGFDPAFRPRDALTAELVALLELMEQEPDLLPKEIGFLNPTFARSTDVGGADADLIADRTLIDFKVVSTFAADMDSMMQLSGYAVLQKLGGIRLSADNIHRRPFARVGLYFARHGKLVTWNVSELFLAAGFDKFTRCFTEELGRWQRGL